MLMSMAAKEKTSSRWAAWLAPILFLLAAVAAAGPASALTCGALETRAWEKLPLRSIRASMNRLQLLNLHQQNESGGTIVRWDHLLPQRVKRRITRTL